MYAIILADCPYRSVVEIHNVSHTGRYCNYSDVPNIQTVVVSKLLARAMLHHNTAVAPATWHGDAARQQERALELLMLLIETDFPGLLWQTRGLQPDKVTKDQAIFGLGDTKISALDLEVVCKRIINLWRLHVAGSGDFPALPYNIRVGFKAWEIVVTYPKDWPAQPTEF